MLNRHHLLPLSLALAACTPARPPAVVVCPTFTAPPVPVKAPVDRTIFPDLRDPWAPEVHAEAPRRPTSRENPPAANAQTVPGPD